MDHDSDTSMVCPECGEPVEARTPDSMTPWQAYGMTTPEYAHLDGEPLCPVVGEHGYEPAQPVPAGVAAEAAQAAVARRDEAAASPATPVDHFDLEVCDDCAQVIANGEINDGTDRDKEVADAQVRVWGSDAVHLVLACGEDCSESFSWAPCDGCGSTLGGNRHPASVRVAQAAEAAQAPVDESRMACPGCGEPVERHPRWREEPGLYTTLGINRDWIHTDGSPLCSMPAVHGILPARPVPAAAAGIGPDGENRTVVPAGEVAGLDDAIAFGESMEQRLRNAAIATEQSLANLQAGGVAGEAVTALTSASETLADAVLAFSSVTQGLRRQLLVREAYQAAPGAGDRDFLTRE